MIITEGRIENVLLRGLGILVVLLLFPSCSKSIFKSKWTREEAPPSFQARFETSKGSFDIEVKREESPHAVDRVYQLIKHHFYDHSIFYRGDSNFVVQFGSSDTVKSNYWSQHKIPDETLVNGNVRGGVSFARAGKETRGTELFINLKDNPFLDTLSFEGVKGFPVFGNVIRGMDVVASIYVGYGDRTMDELDTLYRNRPRFLQLFPKLDLINKAYLLQSK